MERGILFSAPMVRALLAGVKTQTRRAVKWRGLHLGLNLQFSGLGVEARPGGHVLQARSRTSFEDRSSLTPCPYGKPGDRLWVRETHRPIFGQTCGLIAVDYRADPREKWERLGDSPDSLVKPTKWVPSIHMRREYSRILLEIVSVRVERLNDCSEADAIAEGCAKNHNGYFWGGPHRESGTKQMATARKAYCDLWESINGAGSWATNPWVWVVEFKRVEIKQI